MGASRATRQTDRPTDRQEERSSWLWHCIGVVSPLYSGPGKMGQCRESGAVGRTRRIAVVVVSVWFGRHGTVEICGAWAGWGAKSFGIIFGLDARRLTNMECPFRRTVRGASRRRKVNMGNVELLLGQWSEFLRCGCYYRFGLSWGLGILVIRSTLRYLDSLLKKVWAPGI